MNASQRTVVIARGIKLFAELQNMNDAAAIGSVEQHKWNAFRATYPLDTVKFVMQQQADLFDRINARAW
jgi:hypothetical protein